MSATSVCPSSRRYPAPRRVASRLSSEIWGMSSPGAFDRDGRDAATTQRLDRVPESRAAPDEHDGVDGRALDAEGVAARLAGVGEEQQAGAERGDALGDAVEHLDLHGVEEGGADAFLEDDAHDPRSSSAERTPARVGARVAELGCRGQHALLRGIRHRTGAAERERRRRGGHAGLRRDVGERGA